MKLLTLKLISNKLINLIINISIMWTNTKNVLLEKLNIKFKRKTFIKFKIIFI